MNTQLLQQARVLDINEQIEKEMDQFQNDLLASVQQMKADKAARITTVNISSIVATRNTLGLSQSRFAELLGVSKRTLQEWEQGRRAPTGSCQSLTNGAAYHIV